jgi:hypothetical protein
MTRRQRQPIRWLALLGLLAVALTAVACGGSSDDDASSSGGGGGSSSASSNSSDRAVQFAECMRENGVPDFPDPVDGRTTVRMGPGGIDADPATMEAAQQACQDLAPEGAGRANPQMQDQVFAFAECMRENGVPDFPDPDVSGGAVRMMLPRSIDPQSPQFQEAQQACQGEMPQAGGTP